jgi:tripartite-type tricarboxylate transporter receptor subunit TctC
MKAVRPVWPSFETPFRLILRRRGTRRLEGEAERAPQDEAKLTDSRMTHSRFARVFGFALAAMIAALPASAQAPQPFYKGKQVIMLIASGAGGGYDTYARSLARHMGRHIPGTPSIVPKNVPGAGGLIAANTLYNSAAPDGLTFAALTNGAAMDPLFGETAARFDGQKFNWLGSIGKLENICVTWKGSPITRIEQARAKEITVSATGATGNSAIMPRIVNQLLGTRFKVIGGYAEGAGQTLALERGEVDGICGLSYSTLKASRPDWFRDNKLNVILQIGLQKLKDLPNVPSAIDLVTDPDSRRVLELILIRQEMGRPFAMPPGVPADRVAILRQAFNATLKDPAFLAEAGKLQLEIDPLTGPQIAALLKTAYSAPKPIVARAAQLAK